MSAQSQGLKSRIYSTLAWLLVFPFLAVWPFLSAFPLFGLINSSAFDINVSLNILFFLTGFWVVAALSCIYWVLLYDDLRIQARKRLSGKGLWIGAYSVVWTALYMIAGIASH